MDFVDQLLSVDEQWVQLGLDLGGELFEYDTCKHSRTMLPT